MKVGVRQLCFLAALGSCLASLSCNRGDSNPSQAAGTKSAKPAPEESLDLIMATFRRRMEETPIGFVVADGNGRSTLIGTNKVSCEVLRPANPSDPYKAVVTVVSRSTYSIKRTKDNPQEEGGPKSKDDASVVGGEEFVSTNAGGQAPAEPVAGGESAKSSDDVVARRPDEEVRKYELLHRNGKWVLTTELNKETEQSIQNAFNSALAVQ